MVSPHSAQVFFSLWIEKPVSLLERVYPAYIVVFLTEKLSHENEVVATEENLTLVTLKEVLDEHAHLQDPNLHTTLVVELSDTLYTVVGNSLGTQVTKLYIVLSSVMLETSRRLIFTL